MSAPVVILSPHLDDAILSAATFLGAHPGSVVVTAFANGPRTVDPLPEWDLTSNTFRPGDDVIAARRQEDIAAAAAVGATTVHLEHWDQHYRTDTYAYTGPTESADLVRAIVADLAELAERAAARTWVLPLGVLHHDHQLTALAGRQFALARPDLDWLVYDDLPYSAESATDVAAAEARASAMGLEFVPMSANGATPDPVAKTRAVDCYVSQLAALGDRIAVSIHAPERIRRLAGVPSNG